MKHGTIYAYNRCGCRCDDCREARSEYKRQMLADPRVKSAYYRKKNREQRLATAAKQWLAENQPDVLQELERKVA